MLGLLQGDGLEAVFGHAQQSGVRIGHQDRRMGRHDDLADAGLVHAAQQLEKVDLTRRRERRLGLVEDEDALAAATLVEEAQKALAMRVGEEIRRRRSAWIVKRRLIEIAGDRKEAFGTEEPAIGDLR